MRIRQRRRPRSHRRFGRSTARGGLGLAASLLLTSATATMTRPAAADPARPAASPPPPEAPAELSVVRRGAPLPLDATGWSDVPRHALTPAQDGLDAGQALREPGSFQMALAEGALWLRVDFDDSDVSAIAEADGENLYDTGDVAEWFIGLAPEPDGQGGLLPRRYLELHLAPNGTRSAYVIDRPMQVRPLATIPFRGEVRIDGRLDDATERDTGWSAVMELPLSELAELLPGFDAERPRATPLRVLVARYNYSRFLPYRADGTAGAELSMWPTQPRVAFHLRPHHAAVRFAEPDDD